MNDTIKKIARQKLIKLLKTKKKTNEYKSNSQEQNHFVLPSHKLGHFGSIAQRFGITYSSTFPGSLNSNISEQLLTITAVINEV